jgi:hypothetical protein
MKEIEFKLWLEFEEVDPQNWNIDNDFANIHVVLPDGRHYGINIWTFKFFETSINMDKENGTNLYGLYQIPPDLLVKELTRECIEKTIADILSKGSLEDMLNPTVLSNRK